VPGTLTELLLRSLKRPCFLRLHGVSLELLKDTAADVLCLGLKISDRLQRGTAHQSLNGTSSIGIIDRAGIYGVGQNLVCTLQNTVASGSLSQRDVNSPKGLSKAFHLHLLQKKTAQAGCQGGWSKLSEGVRIVLLYIGKSVATRVVNSHN
jgi:hypothetical protein